MNTIIGKLTILLDVHEYLEGNARYSDNDSNEYVQVKNNCYKVKTHQRVHIMDITEDMLKYYTKPRRGKVMIKGKLRNSVVNLPSKSIRDKYSMTVGDFGGKMQKYDISYKDDDAIAFLYTFTDSKGKEQSYTVADYKRFKISMEDIAAEISGKRHPRFTIEFF